MLFSLLYRTLAIYAALIWTSGDAWAHAKVDVITVTNGDQITGAVSAMSAGKLSVSTDYAGTINIKWREVQQIESRYMYEVRLDDGERVYGRWVANDIPNELTFRSSGVERQLDIDDIVEVRSIEEELSDKLDLQLSSTIYADPNNQTLVLSAKGTYDVRGGRTGFSARIDDSKTTSEDDENRVKQTSNASNFTFYREFWRDRGTAQSFRVLNAVYSSNDELGVAHRASLGFGLGRYLINDLGHELAVSMGVQGVQERRGSCDDQTAGKKIDATLVDAEPETVVEETQLETCNDTELFVHMNWHLYSFQDLDMDISVVGNAYPSLSDSGRIRGDLNVLVNWELFDSFFWSVNARTEIDSASDRDNISLSNSDFTISTGVTWKY
ncbi:MAG: hypothetical protein VW202_06160 [Halieaceae bacterium]|jgi:hypothetical protein